MMIVAGGHERALLLLAGILADNREIKDLAKEEKIKISGIRSKYDIEIRNENCIVAVRSRIKTVFAWGDPAELIGVCSHYSRNGKKFVLDERTRLNLMARRQELKNPVGFASRIWKGRMGSEEELRTNLMWIGML